MYFCSVDAVGDVVGDSDKEIRLIVYRKYQHTEDLCSNHKNIIDADAGISPLPLRLADCAAHRPRWTVPHHTDLYLLLPVLSSELLLLCPLSLLSSHLLLPRRRYPCALTLFHFSVFVCESITPDNILQYSKCSTSVGYQFLEINVY